MLINEQGELILSQEDVVTSFQAYLDNERSLKAFNGPITTIRFKASNSTKDQNPWFSEILLGILQKHPVDTLEFDGVIFNLTDDPELLPKIAKSGVKTLILRECSKRTELRNGEVIETHGPIGGYNGANSLAFALGNNSLAISTLVLELENQLSDRSLALLAQGLLTNTTLRTLDLKLGDMSTTSRDKIFTALKINALLTHISLRYQPTSMSDVRGLIGFLNESNANTSLQLSFTNLSMSEANELIQQLNQSTKTSPILISFRSSENAEEIKKHLEKYCTKATFVIGGVQTSHIPQPVADPVLQLPSRLKILCTEQLGSIVQQWPIELTLTPGMTVAETLASNPNLNGKCIRIGDIVLDPASRWERYVKLINEAIIPNSYSMNTYTIEARGSNNIATLLLPSQSQKNQPIGEKKAAFLEKLRQRVKYFDLDTLLKVYKAIQDKAPDSPFGFIHTQTHQWLDNLRWGIFGKNPDGWQTATYQNAVKLLKNRLVELENNPQTMPAPRQGEIENARLDLIHHQRSNFFRTEETTTAQHTLHP